MLRIKVSKMFMKPNGARRRQKRKKEKKMKVSIRKWICCRLRGFS
jgi:hypothetical protein